MEIHAADPLIREPSPFEVEIDVGKLKGINHQVLIKFCHNLFLPIHKLINSIWNKEEVTVEIIKAYPCYQLNTKCYTVSFSQG
jgi:hypothetical protein